MPQRGLALSEKRAGDIIILTRVMIIFSCMMADVKYDEGIFFVPVSSVNPWVLVYILPFFPLQTGFFSNGCTEEKTELMNSSCKMHHLFLEKSRMALICLETGLNYFYMT